MNVVVNQQLVGKLDHLEQIRENLESAVVAFLPGADQKLESFCGARVDVGAKQN